MRVLSGDFKQGLSRETPTRKTPLVMCWVQVNVVVWLRAGSTHQGCEIVTTRGMAIKLSSRNVPLVTFNE